MRAVRHGLAVAGIGSVVAVWALTVSAADAVDAHAYWSARPPVTYGAAPGADGAYLYSPAFAQVLAPFTALPWQVFLALWTALLLVTLAAISGPYLLAPVLLLTFGEIHYGNIHYLIAAAILVGWRQPWAWALMLLTKVTPGVGVLWFAGRGEWRKLGIALGATAALAAASFALDPGAWFSWATFLQSNAGMVPAGRLIPLPLEVRLGLAAALVLWGGRTSRPWTVPLAVVLALPHGTIGIAVLVALIPLLAPGWRGSWRGFLAPIVDRAMDSGTPPAAGLDGSGGRYHRRHAERPAP